MLAAFAIFIAVILNDDGHRLHELPLARTDAEQTKFGHVPLQTAIVVHVQLYQQGVVVAPSQQACVRTAHRDGADRRVYVGFKDFLRLGQKVSSWEQSQRRQPAGACPVQEVVALGTGATSPVTRLQED